MNSDYQKYVSTHDMVEDMSKTEMMKSLEVLEQLEGSSTTPDFRRRTLRRIIGIAATALVLFSAGIWLFKDEGKTDLSSQFISIEIGQYRSDQNQDWPDLVGASDTELEAFLNHESFDLNSALRYILVADIYYQRKVYQRAIMLYDQVIDFNDVRYSNTALWNRALALYQKGDEEEALTIFKDIADTNGHPLQQRAAILVSSTID